MNIAKNLQYLRKRDKITQEELADKLNVSRQSVSKWETGEAYPETDKLLSLCDLFGVSLDDLMRGDVSASVEQAARQTETETRQATEIKTYHTHMNKFSRGIAIGVALILLGVALCVALAGVSLTLNEPYAELTSVMSGMAVILFIAPAVFLFIFNGMRHERFLKANPVIENNCDAETTAAFSSRFAIAIACLVSGILLDVTFLITVTSLTETGVISVSNVDSFQCYITSAFLAALAFIIGGLTYFGIQHAKYNVDEYNEQARIAHSPSSRDKLCGAIGGIIMMSATALFLVLGFVWGCWHPGWVVFPVGGILCGIVGTAIKASGGEK